MLRCTKDRLKIQLDFGQTLLPISTGKRNGAGQSTPRILMSGRETLILRYSDFLVIFFFLILVQIECNMWGLNSVSSGLREEEPTFAITAWIGILKVEMVAKLRSTGKEMSLVLMLL